MAEWILAGEPSIDVVGDGHPPLRPALPLAELHAQAHAGRSTRPTTTSAIPATSARPAGRCAISSAYAWHREHGAAFGEKSGWERVNWYESNAAAGDEILRPRGWAGMHWSPAIGAEHLADARGRGPVRRVVVRQARGRRTGRRRAARAALRQPRRARASARSPTPRCSTGRGGIECDFTVTRVAEERFQIVTGTAFGNHDAELDPPPPARRRLGDRRPT